MADVHDKATRSYNMSRIRSRDTKPELQVRKFLHRKGLRYRLHQSSMVGKPDIVLPKYHSVVFVHGCFWHGHENCPYFVIPATRRVWWRKKINLNIERDKKNRMLLETGGWKVLNIWECQLKAGNSDKYLQKLLDKIKKNTKFVSKQKAVEKCQE